MSAGLRFLGRDSTARNVQTFCATTFYGLFYNYQILRRYLNFRLLFSVNWYSSLYFFKQITVQEYFVHASNKLPLNCLVRMQTSLHQNRTNAP